MNQETTVSNKDLAISLWDFYKAVHGMRPRHIDMSSRDDMLQAFKMLHNYVETQSAEWRAANGWTIKGE